MCTLVTGLGVGKSGNVTGLGVGRSGNVINVIKIKSGFVLLQKAYPGRETRRYMCNFAN